MRFLISEYFLLWTPKKFGNNLDPAFDEKKEFYWKFACAHYRDRWKGKAITLNKLSPLTWSKAENEENWWKYLSGSETVPSPAHFFLSTFVFCPSNWVFPWHVQKEVCNGTCHGNHLISSLKSSTFSRRWIVGFRGRAWLIVKNETCFRPEVKPVTTINTSV